VRILFLDDDQYRQFKFLEMAIGHDVTMCSTAAEAILALDKEFDLICLDHDLGGRTFVDSDDPETGMSVAREIARRSQRLPRDLRVIVHSFNPAGADNMVNCIRAAGIRAIRAPFGTWKIESPLLGNSLSVAAVALDSKVDGELVR